MFDIGWAELILIGIVALIVVGPKDLPGMFRTVGKFMGKARGMAREFQRSMEEAAEDSGVREATRGLNKIDLGLDKATGSARNYARQFMSDPNAPKPDTPKARPDAPKPDPATPEPPAAATPATPATPAATTPTPAAPDTKAAPEAGPVTAAPTDKDAG